MFENIIGHEKQKDVIENMVKNDAISHAYLFYGKKGIGKSLLACEFAKKILNTENLSENPDYTYISKQEDKKEIVIEQIRKNIIDNIYETPIASDKKVYIIDDAEALNMAAQNALLKTLEEPPKYVVIILISNSKSAFLPTILSRVNELNFVGVDKVELKEYVKNRYNQELSEDLLEYVDGSIGKVNEIFNNSYLDKFSHIDKIFDYILEKDLLNIHTSINNVDFSDMYLLDYLEFKLYKNNEFNSIKFIERAKLRLKNNGNYDIVIDSMILKIIDSI